MLKLQISMTDESNIFFDYYFDRKSQISCVSADIAFEGAPRRVFKFWLFKSLERSNS